MTYFRELPNIDYQSPFKERSSSQEYVRVKNLFRRVKLRDDIKDSITYLQNYIIIYDRRPLCNSMGCPRVIPIGIPV